MVFWLKLRTISETPCPAWTSIAVSRQTGQWPWKWSRSSRSYLPAVLDLRMTFKWIFQLLADCVNLYTKSARPVCTCLCLSVCACVRVSVQLLGDFLADFESDRSSGEEGQGKYSDDSFGDHKHVGEWHGWGRSVHRWQTQADGQTHT